jgi:hypothetical protein
MKTKRQTLVVGAVCFSSSCTLKLLLHELSDKDPDHVCVSALTDKIGTTGNFLRSIWYDDPIVTTMIALAVWRPY